MCPSPNKCTAFLKTLITFLSSHEKHTQKMHVYLNATSPAVATTIPGFLLCASRAFWIYFLVAYSVYWNPYYVLWGQVRGEPFDFWGGEGGLEDFPLERFFFPTDQQGRYFFQCKSGAWCFFLCDYPLQEFFFHSNQEWNRPHMWIFKIESILHDNGFLDYKMFNFNTVFCQH